jgi:hypothetical protein
LNAILHPGSVFDHPRDDVTDPTLNVPSSPPGIRMPPP